MKQEILDIYIVLLLVITSVVTGFIIGKEYTQKYLKPTVNSFTIGDQINKMNVTIGDEEYDMELGLGEFDENGGIPPYRALKMTIGKTNFVFDIVYGTNTFERVMVYKFLPR